MKRRILLATLAVVALGLVAARPSLSTLQARVDQLFALVAGLRGDVDTNVAAIDANTASLCGVVAENGLLAPVGLDCSFLGSCTGLPDGTACDDFGPGAGMCMSGACEPSGSCTGQPDGTSCSDFAPADGVCIAEVCEPVPASSDDAVDVLCSNNVTADIDALSYELTVTPLGPVVDGVPVDVALGGVALFPPSFLNAALATIPGLTEVTLTDLLATVQVRSGATGPEVALGPELGVPDTFDLPLVNDAASCTAAGLSTPCVLEPLRILLGSQTATFTPTGGPGGEILFGWDESRFPPITVVLGAPGPIGTRVLAGGVLQIGLECGMGTIDDNGTPGDTSDDFTRTLADVELIRVPIAP